ncbi:hypothetical protein G7046_g7081 [Stylonectria norvegica]|nr:hypothetical protein G7046_g7081 [Stylonectria norvegica]
MFLRSFLFVGIVSAASHIPIRRQDVTTTATSTRATDNAFTVISGCHFHGVTPYCLASGTEYRVIGEATGTVDQPASYTGCHSHGSETYCLSPDGGEVQVLGENEKLPTATATETGSSTPEITAVTECHLHENSVYCLADSTEYYVQTAVAATSDIPAQFTGCHGHGTEIYCMTEDDEVPIILAVDVESGEEAPDESTATSTPAHCVGGGSKEEKSCDRTDRDYDIPIRIGMLFVVLVASAVGVFGPILMSSFIQVKTNLFLTVLKQFGTGVIVSTAFVHLFTHATLMFGNECLGELKYEATTAAILMAGLFISFAIEFAVHRAIRWQASKKTDTNETYLSPQAAASAELANISIMEAGIVFHSLLIGITLVVAGDSFFITLAIVIIFHQMFEGIALGSRIASLGQGGGTLSLASSGHAHSQTHCDLETRNAPSTISLFNKLALASGYALVTPIGMAIGIGVLHNFNGNDPQTIIAIGTLDALSAGILVWVGLVEMWAGDWILGGELTDAGWLTTSLAMFGLLAGMILMSVLGKWA